MPWPFDFFEHHLQAARILVRGARRCRPMFLKPGRHLETRICMYNGKYLSMLQRNGNKLTILILLYIYIIYLFIYIYIICAEYNVSRSMFHFGLIVVHCIMTVMVSYPIIDCKSVCSRPSAASGSSSVLCFMRRLRIQHPKFMSPSSSGNLG